MEHQSDHNHCNCHLTSANASVHQTLSEMEWERGIWNAGDKAKVQNLIDKAKNAKDVINTTDNTGYYALHYAARNGHVDICKMLVQNGALINVQTRSGNATPLHKAAAAGNLATLKFLIECGADISLQDSDGKTVLHKAVEYKHKEIIEYLLKQSKSLHTIKDNKGNLAIVE